MLAGCLFVLEYCIVSGVLSGVPGIVEELRILCVRGHVEARRTKATFETVGKGDVRQSV